MAIQLRGSVPILGFPAIAVSLLVACSNPEEGLTAHEVDSSGRTYVVQCGPGVADEYLGEPVEALDRGVPDAAPIPARQIDGISPEEAIALRSDKWDYCGLGPAWYWALEVSLHGTPRGREIIALLSERSPGPSPGPSP